MDKIILTDRQYQVLTDLYNEMNNAFRSLGWEYKEAFFNRLWEK